MENFAKQSGRVTKSRKLKIFSEALEKFDHLTFRCIFKAPCGPCVLFSSRAELQKER